jgi:hypothetical protein
MHIDSELAEVKKAFNDINDDVKGAVDPKLEPEKKSADQSGTDTDDEETIDRKDEKSESDEFDNLKNLKHAFDNLDSSSNSSAGEETTPADKSLADENQTVTPKGPVDDA